MYQADFWIAWGLLLSESPEEFADHKENAVCLITELQSVPSLPPPVIFLTRDLSFLFNLMFQSPVPPSLPLLFPFPELLLLLLSLLPLPAGVRRSHGVVLRSAFNCPPPLAAEREEMPRKRSK